MAQQRKSDMSTKGTFTAELIWHQVKANPGMTVEEISKYIGQDVSGYVRNLYKSRALDRTVHQKPCANYSGFVQYHKYTAAGDKFPGYTVVPFSKKKAARAEKRPVLDVPRVSENVKVISDEMHRQAVQRMKHIPELDSTRNPVVTAFLLALPALKVNDVMTVKKAIANLFAA